jgi:hypothetical protein
VTNVSSRCAFLTLEEARATLAALAVRAATATAEAGIDA